MTALPGCHRLAGPRGQLRLRARRDGRAGRHRRSPPGPPPPARSASRRCCSGEHRRRGPAGAAGRHPRRRGPRGGGQQPGRRRRRADRRGSADGYPAIWRKAPGGGWRLVPSLSLVSAAPGLAALTSMTHGVAGWLAVGVPGPGRVHLRRRHHLAAPPRSITADMAGVAASRPPPAARLRHRRRAGRAGRRLRRRRVVVTGPGLLDPRTRRERHHRLQPGPRGRRGRARVRARLARTTASPRCGPPPTAAPGPRSSCRCRPAPAACCSRSRRCTGTAWSPWASRPPRASRPRWPSFRRRGRDMDAIASTGVAAGARTSS